MKLEDLSVRDIFEAEIIKQYLAIENAFETEKEAVAFEDERLLVIHELKSYTTPVDIKGDTKEWWVPYYRGEFDAICFMIYESFYGMKFAQVCFNSEVQAKKAIEEVGEDRIIKYYFGVSDSDREVFRKYCQEHYPERKKGQYSQAWVRQSKQLY